MRRKRILTDEEREERQRKGRSNFQNKLAEVCNQVLEEIQENLPHLICWLKGGVNLERANKIREEMEG